MIEIDGSMGEGGGQILRSALSLSLLTGKAFHLSKIRANRRPKAGLQPQHLMSVRAAGTIGSAKISGDSISSSDLTFEPGAIVPGKYRFAIGTAGATSLVLHNIYLPLALQSGPSEITLEGGTHVSTSPCYHFLEATWLPWIKKLGLRIRLEMTRPGFYPRGGGQVIAHIQSSPKVHSLNLTKKCPPVTKATGFSAVAGLPNHVARRQARRVVERLMRVGIVAEIEEREWEGGPGSVVSIIFDELPVPASFFALGERGKPAEKVADEASDQAIAFAEAGTLIDEHSADQLVLSLALAAEASEFRVQTITRHLTTNIAVIRMFIDRDIVCTGEEGSPGIVHISPEL